MVLAISAGVMIYAYTMGYLGIPGEPLDVKVDVVANIFSNEFNIGVLDDISTFNFTITNNNKFATKVVITVYTDKGIEKEEIINIDPESKLKSSFTLKLLEEGRWRIQPTIGDFLLNYGYSFFVMKNHSEATLKINEERQLDFNNKMVIVAVIISVISILASLRQELNFRKLLKKKPSNNVV